MPTHEALRRLIQVYRTQGDAGFSPTQVARLVELAAAAADEVARLRVQVEVMSMEALAHESISAEMAGSLAREAHQSVEANPHPPEPGADSLHDDWSRGFTSLERAQELEFQVRRLEAENIELRMALAAALTPSPAPT